MDYREALNHLERLINYEVQPRAGAVKGLSLDRMGQVMAFLDDPQHAFAAVHITGTNGKGSTARMVESLLGAMGLRVGLYTSPHLATPCERIRVGAAEVDQATFGRAVGDIARLVEAAQLEPLSWFETVTAAALAHFANEAVEAAVVEVGMLGRFDATNVVDGQVAVITNVGRDHTDGAPGWWRRVAQEKAGIVKAGSSVVLGESTAELAEMVAAQLPASIVTPALSGNEVALGGRLLRVETPRATHSDVFVGLHGAHQGHNAASAVCAVEEFFDAPLSSEVLAEALTSVEAPGRLEVVHRGPLILLDAAHNPPGAQALARSLEEDFGGLNRRFLVFGIQDGRDPAEVLEALGAAGFDLLVTTTAPTPRGVAADVLRDTAVSLGARADAVADVATALDFVIDQADDEDLIVVAGSVTVLEVAREFAAEL
ncbi:MAG: Mur ligase family protein [Acidimicrobiaceae bacterium]|nr:bifunctional folylpolyglutamate synthase/dihydrofolate synthase [Acidimicrobiia bacterium]MCY4494569.1 Mur ligase family protein [Acidimicrobiaceae bacterium]